MSARAIPKVRKAGTAAKHATGWTREEFITWAREFLGNLMVLFCEARFASRNRCPRPARRLMAKFERRLAVGTRDLLTHPFKRSFDRRSGCEAVIEEMSRLDVAVRGHLNAEFGRVYGIVTRLLDERDTQAFWMRARTLGATGERSP